MLKHLIATAVAVTGMLGIAHADGLPGLRGHDHTGITVPDMSRRSISSSGRSAARRP